MIIKVKVLTRSSVNQVVGFEGDVLKVKCAQVPEKGKANVAVIALLAQYYKVPKNSIKLLKGQSSSKKIIEIIGL